MDGEGTGRPARQRHRGRPGTKAATLDLLRSLVADERFRTIGASAQVALLVGVLLHADADARWQIKRSTWAEECGWDRQGRSRPPGSIGRAISRAKASGLLVVQPYLRPPGAQTPGQGDSIYRLDPALVARAAGSGSPCRGANPGSATSKADSDAPARGAAGGPPERVLNENLNGARPAADQRAASALGPRIKDQCMGCHRTRAVRDDGRRVLCDECRQTGQQAA
jgi:hypothetical protein